MNAQVAHEALQAEHDATASAAAEALAASQKETEGLEAAVTAAQVEKEALAKATAEQIADLEAQVKEALDAVETTEGAAEEEINASAAKAEVRLRTCLLIFAHHLRFREALHVAGGTGDGCCETKGDRCDQCGKKGVGGDNHVNSRCDIHLSQPGTA